MKVNGVVLHKIDVIDNEVIVGILDKYLAELTSLVCREYEDTMLQLNHAA